MSRFPSILARSRFAESPDLGRRSFLIRLTTAAAALVVAPTQYILRPGTAYAAICGPAPNCGDGYTVFCCTINRGANRCPPGHFLGGWWKADSSSLCCDDAGRPSARYYLDCHARCTCDSGTGPYCDPDCTPCRCRCSDSETCDRRRVCCARFRYGQCNTDIDRLGPVTCRVVTCVPPYLLFDTCGSTLLTDNYTAEQTAPCLSPPCT